MADREYIEKSINLIFDIERRNIQESKIFHFVETFKEIHKDSLVPQYPSGLPILMDLDLKPSVSFILEWDTYTSLKKLYNKIEHFPGCRKMFLSTLEQKLSNLGVVAEPIYAKPPASVFLFNKLHSNASLAFYFLLKIDRNDLVIRALQTKMKKNAYWDKYRDLDSEEIIDFKTHKCRDDIEGLFRDVLIFMHNEPTYFDELLLDQLAEIIHCEFHPTSLNIKKEFEDKILTLKYDRLKIQLESSNEELNIHKEQIIEMISRYGFPLKMEKFLLEIDEIPELSNWQLVISGMIGKLRSFFEELVKSIAKKIYDKTGENYPTDRPSEMGNLRAYIKENLKLSKRDNELINAFVNILNKEVSHALTSEKR
jgi:hypothetical protein